MAKHAEIAGAGFGGLVAAIALARAGWSVRVHERTPFLRSEGYGIAIHRNGILVLKTLGVFDEILKGSVRVSHLETRLADGTLTSQVPAKLTYRISRQHMVGVLCSAAEKAGVEVRSRLRISEACPLILPFHAALDVAREAAREQGGTEKIGTTGRGIGRAYEDKIARRALRVQDLKHPERFAAKLRVLLVLH